MQAAHDLDGFNVDRVLLLKLVLLVARDECEGMNVFVEISQRKFDARHAPVAEEREMSLVLRLEVVQGDAGKVGNDDVSGNFVRSSFAREVLNVAEGLRLGFAEVFAAALVLDQYLARPEQINVAVIAGNAS